MRDINGNNNVLIGQQTNYKYQAENIAIHLTPTSDWASPDQEIIARQKCIEAFFRDVKEVHHERSLVVLLDSYEDPRKLGDLYDWIQDNVLDPYALM